jgi:hypothetical protein
MRQEPSQLESKLVLDLSLSVLESGVDDDTRDRPADKRHKPSHLTTNRSSPFVNQYPFREKLRRARDVDSGKLGLVRDVLGYLFQTIIFDLRGLIIRFLPQI